MAEWFYSWYLKAQGNMQRSGESHPITVIAAKDDTALRPVIAVPVHRQNPTSEEVISLRQLNRVMGRREIALITPQGNDISAYRDILPTAKLLRVEPRWMESHSSYSRMIISPLLPDAFRGHTHMLLHEPDSIVLKDTLDDWCDQPYDYIGAPWFAPMPNSQEVQMIPGGNSGLSLFRLSAVRRVLTSWKRWHPLRYALSDLLRGFRGDKEMLKRGLLGFYPGGLLRGAHHLYPSLCDRFWSLLVPSLEPRFRVAPPSEAVGFSWEKWSFLCMERCGGHLPLGVHAWAKYDFDFLEPHFIAAGVDLYGMPLWVPPEWRRDWKPPMWPVGHFS